MTKLAACAAAIALLLPVAGSAATQQKPGLWSATIKIDLGKDMPQFDPAMLEQMKAMGIELPFVEPVTQNVCLTKEQVSKNTLPDFNDAGSGCSAKNVKRIGDSLNGDLECDGQLKGKGTVQMNLTGPESYTGTSNFVGTQDGRPVTIGTQFSGRWLQSDCGQVKPFGS